MQLIDPNGLDKYELAQAIANEMSSHGLSKPHTDMDAVDRINMEHVADAVIAHLTLRASEYDATKRK